MSDNMNEKISPEPTHVLLLSPSENTLSPSTVLVEPTPEVFLESAVKKKKGKENWQFLCHPENKEAALEIIMKPYKHIVKHTTKLIRGMSATYQCTVHVSCQHAYKLVEKHLPDRVHWTLSELNTHGAILAPKPRGIDPAIRAKVDEFACLGASPLHILESLAACSDFKDAELPTRDQISNRIHGRESKKRKMAALQTQPKVPEPSKPQSQKRIHQSPPYSEPSNSNLKSSCRYQYHPQTFVSDEQSFLEMFGPHLLYHSVYYHEYGMGMIVTSPTDFIAPPLKIPVYSDSNLFSSAQSLELPSLVQDGPSIKDEPEGMVVTTLESVVPNLLQPLPLPMEPPLSNGNSKVDTLLLQSIGASPHESVPIPTHIQRNYPQWTLLFLHTPPDENGYYMQCPLGCPDCVNGRVHLLVDRAVLIAGLIGAVEVAHVGSPSNHPIFGNLTQDVAHNQPSCSSSISPHPNLPSFQSYSA